MTYKQIVQDIQNYISVETATIDRILVNKDRLVREDIRISLIAEREALEDIDKIVRDGKKGKRP